MKKTSIDGTAAITNAYGEFSAAVRTALTNLVTRGEGNVSDLNALLNGGAAEALRNNVPRNLRSADGIFFSNEELAEYVASRLENKLKSGSTVADPACGAGDLLLACAKKFKTTKACSALIPMWGDRVFGFDIHAAFVDVAKTRLALLGARTERKKNVGTISEPFFENIRLGNYFEQAESISHVDCVVMNPPFSTVIAPESCKWAQGNVQLAGLFVSTILENAKQGQEVVAILPDVLRSGSRYARWRKFVASIATVKDIHVHGRFDDTTDVDVFILHLTKNSTPTAQDPINWLFPKEVASDTPRMTMQDKFKVSVGAFVPFRAKSEDRSVDYLSVAYAKADAKVRPMEQCNFNGTLHEAPFVVIRRTSNPSDPRRIIPTLIVGKKRIAVENHLIVIKPIDGTSASCQRLMNNLMLPYVDEWVNQAIRCRHLTTEIIKNLPLTGWQ